MDRSWAAIWGKEWKGEGKEDRSFQAQKAQLEQRSRERTQRVWGTKRRPSSEAQRAWSRERAQVLKPCTGGGEEVGLRAESAGS